MGYLPNYLGFTVSLNGLTSSLCGHDSCAREPAGHMLALTNEATMPAARYKARLCSSCLHPFVLNESELLALWSVLRGSFVRIDWLNVAHYWPFSSAIFNCIFESKSLSYSPFLASSKALSFIFKSLSKKYLSKSSTFVLFI